MNSGTQGYFEYTSIFAALVHKKMGQHRIGFSFCGLFADVGTDISRAVDLSHWRTK